MSFMFLIKTPSASCCSGTVTMCSICSSNGVILLLFPSSPCRPEPGGALWAGGHPQEEGRPAAGDTEAPRGVKRGHFGGGGAGDQHGGQVGPTRSQVSHCLCVTGPKVLVLLPMWLQSFSHCCWYDQTNKAPHRHCFIQLLIKAFYDCYFILNKCCDNIFLWSSVICFFELL